MKKLLLPLLLLFVVSCSKSDEGSGILEDPIVGVWKPISSGEAWNGNYHDEEYSECIQRSRYSFSSQGKVDFSDYSEDENGQCVEVDRTMVLEEGTWNKISENKYELRMIYYNSETDQKEIEADSPEVIFPDDKTMRIYYYYDETREEFSFTEFYRVK